MIRELIGIDCACDPRSVGLARGYIQGHALVVGQVIVGSKSEDISAVVAQWMLESSGPVLLALDAPLGWPAPLASALSTHQAGDYLASDAHTLFRRSTDRFVRTKVGQQSLDVGADRIARTAHLALQLLGNIRARTSETLPLAWSPDYTESSAIEVYPAATLRAHGFDPRGYKGKAGEGVRRTYLDRLMEFVQIDAEPRLLVENADAFDSVICLLAAADFVRGLCYAPPQPTIARREGWIWVKNGRT